MKTPDIRLALVLARMAALDREMMSIIVDPKCGEKRVVRRRKNTSRDGAQIAADPRRNYGARRS